MRSVYVAACVGLALLASGCGLRLEEKLISLGVGTDLPAEDIAEASQRLDTYLRYLCQDAGMTRRVSDGEGSHVVCDTKSFGGAAWTLLVRAGFNDIDRRCDSYLAWLNSRRRNRTAILNQIADVRNFTEALLFTTGASATPITIVGLAFGLASNTFTNYYSRLIVEIEKSTVELVVHEKRLKYRETLRNTQISFQPDAVHVLHEYLLICTPHYIENIINQRTRDSVAGNTPADKSNPDQIRKSVVADALLKSIPKERSRGKVRGAPKADLITGGITAIEKKTPKAIGQTIQANLCVAPTGNFGGKTREAIRQAKVAANMSRVHLKAEPIFRAISNDIKTATELQIFLDARFCSKDSSGADRGYVTAYEKFRFADEIAIKDLQKALSACDGNVKQTGVFDAVTRTAIMNAKAKADATTKKNFSFPNTNKLSEKSYKWVGSICVPT